MNRGIFILITISSVWFPVSLLADTKANEALQNRYSCELSEKNPPQASPELLKRINSINKHINSREWKQQHHRYLGEFSDTLDLAEGGHAAPENRDIPADREGRLVLFISSSMPEHVINRYARDLSVLNGVMVMRGGIDGIRKIKPTLAFIHRVLRKDRQCQLPDCDVYPVDILIHPELFITNDITRVPALIFVSDDSLANTCEQQNSSHNSKEADIIYGDATLEGMVEALYTMTGDIRLKPYLKKNHEK